MPYHHGDLRHALMATALEVISEHGPMALSLRDVARRAGVSHAAPTHHFRDKTGLLTAIAAEGWALLADALGEVPAGDRSFSEMGVAYVVFATTHPAHFAVMRAPGLVRGDDPDVVAAQLRAGAALQTEPDGGPRDPTTALAGWALVHGLSALVLEGLVSPEPGSDVETLARSVTRQLGRQG